MKNTLLTANRGAWSGARPTTVFALAAFLSLAPFAFLQAQCNTGSSFTKITNTSGTAAYPGTNGNPTVNVTTTSTGDAGVISFCNIAAGFRAGLNDRSGSFRFAFSPAVNGIFINLNALSNTPNDREVVRIKINNAFYAVTAANVVCSAACFGCSGTSIDAAGGAVTASPSNTGNGTGQLLIQSVGPITSLEYINEVQADEPQGSVFEIFFNNSTCVLPVMLTSFTATASAAGTQLRWTASAQINLRSYQPERSTDGVNFTALAQVPASAAAGYQYTDVTAPAGTTYYRLKLVDRVNGYAFSPTVAVTTMRASHKILFTAANNVLTVNGLSSGSLITVYTLTGGKLAEVTAGLQTESISTAQWPTGLYVVKVLRNGDIVAVEKFFKP